MFRSNKYKRVLAEYEAKRFLELADLFKKLYGEKYDGRTINNKSKETLEDVACSKQRYVAVAQFYRDRLRDKKNLRDTVQVVEITDIPPEIREQMDRVIEALEAKHCEGECDCEENLIAEMVDHLMSSPEGVAETKEMLKEVNPDMLAASHIYKEAFDLMKSRNTKYGDSWKVLSIQSLANLCEMKLHRIANLDKIEPKIYDEMIDTLNYMVFGLLKLKEQDPKKHYAK